MQHTVGREADTRHYISRIKGCLLYIGKIILRITIQLQNSHFNQRILFLRPDLGQVERIKRTISSLLFRHQLDIHRPSREITPLDAFVQITLMTLAVFCDDSFCLLIGKVLDALLGMQMEFHPHPFATCINQRESMATIPMHMTVRSRNTTVAHGNSHLMQGFRERSPEIPVIKWTTHKEDRSIVAYQIPIAFFCIKLNGKATDIALCIRRATLSGYRRKTDKHFRFLTNSRKYSGFGICRNIIGYRKLTKSSRTFGMHTTFGNHFTVEMSQFFQKPSGLADLRLLHSDCRQPVRQKRL